MVVGGSTLPMWLEMRRLSRLCLPPLPSMVDLMVEEACHAGVLQL
jgi:hypothetical protein